MSRMGAELEGVRTQATVVLTREPEDNVEIRKMLEADGVHVVEVPCIRTSPVPLSSGLPLAGCRVVVFTSRRAVAAVAREARAIREGKALLAVVGEGTADAVRRLIGRDPDLSAEGEGAAALARRIGSVLRSGCVLHPCGDRARPELRKELSRQGMTVREVTVYVTETPRPDTLALAAGSIVVFASPSAAEAFFAANGGCHGHVRCVAIGETTALRLRELGVRAVIRAEGSRAADLAAAVRRLMRERPGAETPEEHDAH